MKLEHFLYVKKINATCFRNQFVRHPSGSSDPSKQSIFPSQYSIAEMHWFPHWNCSCKQLLLVESAKGKYKGNVLHNLFASKSIKFLNWKCRKSRFYLLLLMTLWQNFSSSPFPRQSITPSQIRFKSTHKLPHWKHFSLSYLSSSVDLPIFFWFCLHLKFLHTTLDCHCSEYKKRWVNNWLPKCIMIQLMANFWIYQAQTSTTCWVIWIFNLTTNGEILIERKTNFCQNIAFIAISSYQKHKIRIW